MNDTKELPTKDFVSDVRGALHDLAQPLTAMQCRLFLCTMDGDDAQEMRRAIDDALVECERMMRLTRELSERLEQWTTGDESLGRAA